MKNTRIVQVDPRHAGLVLGKRSDPSPERIPSTTRTVNEARAYDPSRPRTVTLRCRVVGVEGSYHAPNLMQRELSDAERLGNLEPTEFSLMLHGALTADDGDAMRALAALSRSGGSVTVRVEVGE